MLNLTKLAACAVFMAASMNAAIISFDSVNGGVWSTGFSTGNVLLSGGSVDPHYTLIKTPAGCAGTLQCQETSTVGDNFGPNSYVVLGPNGSYPLNGAWTANDANSQWTGPRADQTNPCVPGGPLCGATTGNVFPFTNVFASATDFYVYRLVFNLTSLGLNPGQANIQLAWLSDNNNNASSPLETSHIRLCSIGSAADPVCGAGSMVANSGNPGQGAAAMPTSGNSGYVTINSGFGSGLMALDFIVYNSVIPSGQLNPSGFRVDIISATASDVPEPGTLALFGLGLAALGFARRKR